MLHIPFETSVLILQPIECVAAIAWEAKKPLDVTTVIVDPPQKGEVRVKVCQRERSCVIKESTCKV